MVVKSKKKLPCEIRADMIWLGVCPDCGENIPLWSLTCRKCDYVYYMLNHTMEW